MNVVLFCHSLLSDWNHGNAHFLRGLVCELVTRGHAVHVFEPEDAWSVQNLLAETGELPLADLRRHYPELHVTRYAATGFEPGAALDGADLVIVHEWTAPELVAQVGRLRAAPGARFKVLFHDTHHRSVTASETMSSYDLSSYDGVLAFGEAVRERYLQAGWSRRAWVFHEAADIRVFKPFADVKRTKDLCFIGNWGDDERTSELQEFLFGPAKALALSGTVHGVRYPEAGLRAVEQAGLNYGGWVANYRAPEVLARHRVTVHVPRRPYAEALPGIPTIRVFEALACGIPLVSAPWSDSEGLFREGDILFVRNGEQAKTSLRALVSDEAMRAEFAQRGRQAILARHTCAHRADALLDIARQIGARDSERLKASAERRTSEVQGWD